MNYFEATGSPPIPMSLGLATLDVNARSALDCGGSTPPWNYAKEEDQGGVEPPQSKAPSAHAFS